jgi:hypothetical protein
MWELHGRRLASDRGDDTEHALGAMIDVASAGSPATGGRAIGAHGVSNYGLEWLTSQQVKRIGLAPLRTVVRKR